MARVDRLRLLADDLQTALGEAPVGVKAQLAAQYRATLAELDGLESAASEKAGDPVDEIAARRAARGGATSRLGKTSGR